MVNGGKRFSEGKIPLLAAISHKATNIRTGNISRMSFDHFFIFMLFQELKVQYVVCLKGFLDVAEAGHIVYCLLYHNFID